MCVLRFMAWFESHRCEYFFAQFSSFFLSIIIRALGTVIKGLRDCNQRGLGTVTIGLGVAYCDLGLGFSKF